MTSSCKQDSDAKQPSSQETLGQHQLREGEIWSHTGLPKLVNGSWATLHHTRQSLGKCGLIDSPHLKKKKGQINTKGR